MQFVFGPAICTQTSGGVDGTMYATLLVFLAICAHFAFWRQSNRMDFHTFDTRASRGWRILPESSCTDHDWREGRPEMAKVEACGQGEENRPVSQNVKDIK